MKTAPQNVWTVEEFESWLRSLVVEESKARASVGLPANDLEDWREFAQAVVGGIAEGIIPAGRA